MIIGNITKLLRVYSALVMMSTSGKKLYRLLAAGFTYKRNI
jgi:hypothetical protein